MTEWESVTPRRDARFVGWGDKEGQHITGKVLEVGTGFDMNDNRVPELTIELTEPAASFVKGGRTDYEVGTEVIVTCGQSNLKKNITAAALSPGDLVKITLDSFFQTGKGKAKIFDVKVARGAGGPVAPRQPASVATAPAEPSLGSFDDEAPF